MKRILTGITLIALMFSLAACTKEAAEPEKEVTAEEVTEAPMEESATKEEPSNEDKTEEDVMYPEIDIEALPQEEKGDATVSEEFTNLPDMIEAQHVTDNFSMILTFYFEEDKAINGHVTSIYSDITQAKSVYDSYLKNTEYYANVTREEGKITYTHTETSFEAYKDMSKEEVKASLIESGFEITKE